MKKKLIMLGIITVLVVVTASLGACSKSSTTVNQLSTTTTSATAEVTAAIPTSSASPMTSAAPTPSSTTTTAPPASTSSQTTAASSTPVSSGNGLSDLVDKAAKVAYYSCQVSMTSGTTTQSMTESVKTGNPTELRIEISIAGQTTDEIFDGQNYYMYMPASNTAYEVSAATIAANTTNANSITQDNPVLIGPDTINGMDCTVYQYTAQGVTSKIWIWNEYGLPVQIVSGTTTIVYSNFSFSAIPDSEFQLPTGVTITTMPTIPTTSP